MQLNVRSFLALFATIFLWASAFVGIRDALHAYSPVPLAVLRYLVASIVLVGYAVLTKMDLPERKDLPGIFLLGLLGIALYNIALNYGEQTVTAGAASLLVNTVPIFTALFAAAFLREQVNRRGWLGILSEFTGAAMISLGESRGIDVAFDWGVLLVLLAALVQAGYFTLQKFYLDQYSPLELTSYALWTGTFLMLPFAGGLWTEMRTASLLNPDSRLSGDISGSTGVSNLCVCAVGDGCFPGYELSLSCAGCDNPDRLGLARRSAGDDRHPRWSGSPFGRGRG